MFINQLKMRINKNYAKYVVGFEFTLFGKPRERQASIVLERCFRFEFSQLSILCMLIARMEMGTNRVSGDSDIIT